MSVPYPWINFALFQLGWFACVLGSAKGRPWTGPAFVAFALAVHLRSPERRREAGLIACAALGGTALDSVLVSAGIYRPASGLLLPWLAPPWITALWFLFATTLRHCLGWLAGRYTLAALFGFLGSPMSFLAAERLGALSLPADGRPMSLFTFAWTWALAMLGLLWLTGRLDVGNTKQ